ncbi:monoglyceride lipase [Eurytemora carolleeae]|uniref:monoglyceride lipase n=1 Tax=Eurytemora carolleeae TaxID=1294199 RepID=UPI000C786CA5|nr:monoglyceride lipase [Eurytemora carolleeae]|eukprot:XP_023321474.1 monoglyceride lipase-like [Eurytemora affinis]
MYNEEDLENSRGEKLAVHTWKPRDDEGFYVFGHDHVGHGKSDGRRVYIENVDDYCDDVIQHCLLVKEKYPSLKLFIVGHSMGGMITVRSALMHKNFFHGMILNGPLIIPGPQVLGMDLRASPFRTFVSRAVLKFLSLFIPETPLGGPDLHMVTRDMEMHKILKKDELRWTGGCKVRLLLAFTDCLDENINQLSDVRTPFLIIHGSKDILCNPVGSDLLYRRSMCADKKFKVYEGSKHQLFFELPHVRNEAFQDVAEWIKERT